MKHAKIAPKLSRDYHILKQVKCIGGKPAVMSVANSVHPGDAAGGASAPAGKAEEPKKAAPPAAKATAAPSSTAASTSSSKAATVVPAATPEATPAEPATIDGLEVPKVTLVYRDNFDLSNHTQARVSTASSRPKFIVARVELPALVRWSLPRVYCA